MFGLFVGIPALILAFLSANIHGITAKDEGMPIFVLLLIAFLGGGFLSWALWDFLVKKPEKIACKKGKIRLSSFERRAHATAHF